MAATDVAALYWSDARSERCPLIVWAEKVAMRERQLRKAKGLDQGGQDWHDWRNRGVGGSEVGSVMGVNPWKSPQRLYKEKVGEITGEAENENMRRGKRLEPEARELYESLFGWKVEPLCVIHDEYDFVRCSLDGLRDDDDLIAEIKSPGVNNHEKNLRLASIADPVERSETFRQSQGWYWFQCHYQMLVTSASLCHFISYNKDDYADYRKLAVVELRADKDVQAEILDRVKEFWSFVESRTPPPPEWGRKSKAASIYS